MTLLAHMFWFHFVVEIYRQNVTRISTRANSWSSASPKTLFWLPTVPWDPTETQTGNETIGLHFLMSIILGSLVIFSSCFICLFPTLISRALKGILGHSLQRLDCIYPSHAIWTSGQKVKPTFISFLEIFLFLQHLIFNLGGAQNHLLS